MRARFDSSHVSGDFSNGRLEIEIAREEIGASQTIYDRILFAVPPDFHVHNDLVAAALMTLVGRAYPDVTFNFPISQRCAELLTAHYTLNAVGPVEPNLEARQRGNWLGLSFSGGIDSSSALVLLEEIGAEVKVITADYGGPFARERESYEQFQRDVTCATDFRAKGFDRHGRFNFAVPLLFADYLDLYGLATGHNYHHNPPTSIESLARGQEPLFRRYERPFTAGGLDEVHLIRSLTLVGSLKILLTLAPERFERMLTASSSPRNPKYFSRAMIARWLCRQAGQPIPAFLDSLQLPLGAPKFGTALVDFNAVFQAKHYGAGAGDNAAQGISDHDLSFLDDLTLNFYQKYNTNLITFIPEAIRDDFLAALHRCGIYPYDERDWRELSIVRDFLYAVRGQQGEAAAAGMEATQRSRFSSGPA